MKADEFRRKFDHIISKYNAKYKAITVKVFFDGGYTECTDYKIWNRNVILKNYTQISPIFTVIRLSKIKGIRLGRKAL